MYIYLFIYLHYLLGYIKNGKLHVNVSVSIVYIGLC